MTNLRDVLGKVLNDSDAARIAKRQFNYIPKEDIHVNSHWFSVTKLRDLSIIAACLSVALFCIGMTVAVFAVALDILKSGMP